ncbi:MAG: amidase family protein [Rubrivivax sp.]
MRQLRPEAELRPRAGVSAVAVRHRGAPGPAHDERARRGARDEPASRPDARDWTSLPPETPHGGAHDYTVGLEDGIRGLRVAWSPTLGYAKNVHPEIAAACAGAVQRLAELGAVVEQVDPGFEDPLEITTGLWFVGAWTLWNTLTREQQQRTDPDFAAEAALGSKLSALEVQRLHLRRGMLGSHMRQFMQSWDLLVTPTVAVPAFDAKPAGHAPMEPRRCSAGHRSATRST